MTSHRSPSVSRLAVGSALGLALAASAAPAFAQDNDGEYWLARKNQLVITATRTAVRVAVMTSWFLRASQYSPSLSCAKAGAALAASARPSALPTARRDTDGERWLVNFLPLIKLRLTRNSVALGAPNQRVKMLLRIVCVKILASGTALGFASIGATAGSRGSRLLSTGCGHMLLPVAKPWGGGSAKR